MSRPAKEQKSAATPPPNLRAAEEGSTERCGTCHMHDELKKACWGYGNFPVNDFQVCDSYEPETDTEANSADQETPMTINTLDHELRGKYSAEELKKMAKNGQAMPDESYPIGDTSDLRKAIRAVGRGTQNSHNAIRKHIMSRAKALGHSDLIPDNWNSDGSLESKAGGWETDEQRLTYSDLMVAVSDCLQEETGNSWSTWIQDMDAEANRFYYVQSGLLFGRDFVLGDDGEIELGEAERVRPITSYVATEREAEPKPEHRRARMTMERRRERAASISELHHRASVERHVTRPFEVRDDEDSPIIVLRSYASVFDEPYTIRGGAYSFEESVARGAFKRSLSHDPDVVFRTEHAGPPLARTGNGSLRIGEDDIGLWYEADLQRDDPDVQALVPKVRRGDYDESSFAFRCNRDTWNDDRSKRVLQECDIHRGDVSVVTFGASPATGRYMTLRFEEQLRALRSVSPEEFIDAWIQWRNWTLLSMEARVGAKFSSDSREVLLRVLNMVADADENVDEAQVLLSDLLDVPNPDEDDSAESESESESTEEANSANLAENAEQNAENGAETESRADFWLPPSRYDEFEVGLRSIGAR